MESGVVNTICPLGLKFKEGTSIVDVPTQKQIKNNRDDKFLEHPFDAASYLVEFFYPIK